MHINNKSKLYETINKIGLNNKHGPPITKHFHNISSSGVFYTLVYCYFKKFLSKFIWAYQKHRLTLAYILKYQRCFKIVLIYVTLQIKF